jgi:hypothetical protein
MESEKDLVNWTHQYCFVVIIIITILKYIYIMPFPKSVQALQ